MPSKSDKDSFVARLSRTPSPNKDPDAGLRGLGHYERRMPKWRFWLRQRLIPVVRWETPYLARMQEMSRSPWLDTYFALTANLGTHTFFMTALPICFWCGFPGMGIALVQMLAAGVYLSGAVKDMVCLPRPLSPPLQRITMSGSAALEYGFPSTHTTNAVSVAIFCAHQIHLMRGNLSPWTNIALQGMVYCYALSITVGRMYCGMHGFFDVIFGAMLGAVITWVRIALGEAFDSWLLAGDWKRIALVTAAILLAVRTHPEPADNCPCFDDSVAFLGVVVGVCLGIWQHAQGHEAAELPGMYAFDNHNLIKLTARLVGGIVVVFMWRALAKPTLLRVLPPVFRFVDKWGFRIPRRYFLQSRQYKRVPPLRKDDNVIPPASEISTFMSKLRHPRVKRAVSVGPQSEADARELIANREQRRRKRRSGSDAAQLCMAREARRETTPRIPGRPDHEVTVSSPSSPPNSSGSDYLDASASNSTRRRQLLEVEAVSPALLTPPASDAGASSDSGREDEQRDREMFSTLEKPRIRYDVEVITKLVVYAGIAWWAVEGNPLLFRAAGIV